MTESHQPTPRTGEPAVDEALAGLDDLADRPLAEHHDHLSRAHEALHDALHATPSDSAGAPAPGERR